MKYCPIRQQYVADARMQWFTFLANLRAAWRYGPRRWWTALHERSRDDRRD
jgi:hypothetical protein